MKKQMLLLTMIIIFCVGARTVYSQGGSWVEKENMSVARNFMSTGVVNGIVYSIGGSLDPYTSTSDVEAYDAATDSWTSKADLPQKLCGTTAGTVNDKIYVVGGGTFLHGGANGYVVDSVYEYNPVSNSWTRKSNIPTPLYLAAADVVNGKIYVIGGAPHGAQSAYKTVYEYNPATDTWTKKSDMPTARFNHSATTVDGKIYVFGGSQTFSSPSVLSEVEAYDPATDKWTTKSRMRHPRATHATSLDNGKIYVIGGMLAAGTDGPWPPYAIVDEYDPILDAWAMKPSTHTERWGLAARTVGGKIYTFGGADLWSNRLSTVEEYDPAVDITSVGESNNPSLPVEYSLSQNYPNPFNPTTTIEFSVPRSSYVTLKVFSFLGEEVATLAGQDFTAGSYRVAWNPKDVASGVYVYRLVAGSFVETKKMLLLR